MLSDNAERSARCEELLDKASYASDTLFDLTYTEKCIPAGWEDFFDSVKPQIKVISDRLQHDTEDKLELNPRIGWVFRAFDMVPVDQVKVIIMGQNPSPQPGLGSGLSFSLQPEIPAYAVPSVQRVVLEARNEGFCVNESNGNLIPWAEQGVLLLNTALTVITKDSGSHVSLWRSFTYELLKFLNKNAKPSVWILWGSKAKALASKIDSTKNFILTGGSPSPPAAGSKFFCHNYFACANIWLQNQGRGGLDWNLAPVPCEKHESRIFTRKYSYPGYYERDTCTMKKCEVELEVDRCEEILKKASYATHTLSGVLYTDRCQPKTWETFFASVESQIGEISERLKQESDQGLSISPKIGLVFRAFSMVPLDKVRVVIMGQDPIPDPGLATGLSLSLDPAVPSYKVPGVQRVLLEARNEGFCVNETNGDLVPWVKQGVLLLNSALTVNENKSGSHISLWKNFTTAVVNFINSNASPSVWILLGRNAKSFADQIDASRHLVLTGGHPSRQVRGRRFFCKNYFACANNWLQKQGRGEVDWNLAPAPCEKPESRLFMRLPTYPGYREGRRCAMRECTVWRGQLSSLQRLWGTPMRV